MEQNKYSNRDLIVYCTAAFIVGAAVAAGFCGYIRFANAVGAPVVGGIVSYASIRGHIPGLSSSRKKTS